MVLAAGDGAEAPSPATTDRLDSAGCGRGLRGRKHRERALSGCGVTPRLLGRGGCHGEGVAPGEFRDRVLPDRSPEPAANGAI
jgi:hypothetical protein